ncbi:MAG TPA: c-type cytochrome domain-containing protein [Gemmataceae bacterium]|jgi:type IV secretory pathway VirB10-like protein|nr:c-type cytochrome domain-containing protein [Gemmataceae bacterium]
MPARPIRQAAPLPMPLPAFEPLARPRRANWKWAFRAVFGLMMILGFEVGFKAGTSKPTQPKKPVAIAQNKPTKPISKPDPDPPINDPEATPKPKTPELKEPKETQPKMPDPKEPETKVTPEPPPEPKMEKKTEPKTEPKMEAKVDPKTPPKTEPKMEAKKPLVPPKAGMEVTFSRVVNIFKDKCVNCHGGASKKAELDVRSAKEAIKGGESGAGIVPGDPAGSLIWQSIDTGTMPPKGKPQLTADEKKLIKDWIAGGAKP